MKGLDCTMSSVRRFCGLLRSIKCGRSFWLGGQEPGEADDVVPPEAKEQSDNYYQYKVRQRFSPAHTHTHTRTHTHTHTHAHTRMHAHTHTHTQLVLLYNKNDPDILGLISYN